MSLHSKESQLDENALSGVYSTFLCGVNRGTWSPVMSYSEGGISGRCPGKKARCNTGSGPLGKKTKESVSYDGGFLTQTSLSEDAAREFVARRSWFSLGNESSQIVEVKEEQPEQQSEPVISCRLPAVISQREFSSLNDMDVRADLYLIEDLGPDPNDWEPMEATPVEAEPDEVKEVFITRRDDVEFDVREQALQEALEIFASETPLKLTESQCETVVNNIMANILETHEAQNDENVYNEPEDNSELICSPDDTLDDAWLIESEVLARKASSYVIEILYPALDPTFTSGAPSISAFSEQAAAQDPVPLPSFDEQEASQENGDSDEKKTIAETENGASVLRGRSILEYITDFNVDE